MDKQSVSKQKIKLAEIQPILDKIDIYAKDMIGEPYTIEVTLWNDGTYQVLAFQNLSGSKTVYYVSSENLFKYHYYPNSYDKKSEERILA